MKLHFLGTCAGTEPMPTRKHTAFAVECGDRLCWFDAGEGCSYTAHQTAEGVLFDDGNLRVTAVHHNHMQPIGEEWQSFSFLIEGDGQKLVYSVDVKRHEEMDSLIADGYTKYKAIGKILFNHNGRYPVWPGRCGEKGAGAVRRPGCDRIRYHDC